MNIKIIAQNFSPHESSQGHFFYYILRFAIINAIPKLNMPDKNPTSQPLPELRVFSLVCFVCSVEESEAFVKGISVV
ncbi:MAG: hypothetical protein IJP69_00400 [Synergistaceae bacterium]|nr:hypothetical protein [Synergistaceae bacterium]MBR0253697.1 hypothetical protein [Synergistaceae bacterium]